MPLSPGDKLGNFDVLSLLGRGGMGEVYRARDTQLKREVALKVLPAVFSSDPDRLARFQREAELLASLDHPNIGHIYGMVQSERNWALVLALIEGPTLDDRIKQGPLPPDEAIAISKQVIDAMEYAHDNGVIHRDLKPANIKVTPDGVVKVLDFGLAKALDQRASTSFDPENSPTLTMGATQAGVIMGTAAYMSPEQAVGKPADRRSDIFSFGAVLYEMLTGTRPFRGDSMGDTLAAVVKDTPDWSALPEGTPSHLRKLLERLLAKDRKERLQAIGEARIALSTAALNRDREEADRQNATVLPAPSRSRFGVVAWVAAVVFAMAFAAVAFLHFREAPVVPAAPIRFTVQYPPSTTSPAGFFQTLRGFALSPDGRFLAFTAADESGKTTLWLRRLDSYGAQNLDGTAGATLPFWSPDSQEIAFFGDGILKRISLSGGSPITVCPAPNALGGSWNQAGQILFASEGQVQLVSASGGSPSAATALDPPKGRPLFPLFLPDGERFLYALQGTSGGGGVYLQTLGSPDRKLVTPDSLGGFAAPNHLLLVRNGAAMVQDVDLATFAPLGDPWVLESGVPDLRGAVAGMSVSHNGTAVFPPAFQAGQGLSVYQRDGRRADLPAAGRDLRTVALSPDGRRLVVVRVDISNNADLWLLEIASGVFSRLTSDAGSEVDPTWSADSQRVLFGLRTPAKNELREITVGTSSAKVIYGNPDGWALDDWTRDGKWIVFRGTDQKTRLLQYGEQKPQLLNEVPRIDQTHVSPDGRWVAYNSSESGSLQVYVAAFPSFQQKRQLSAAGGAQPQWRGDGKELYYLTPDRKLMAVDIRSGATLETGPAHALFLTNANFNGEVNLFVPSPDGQRFYVAEPSPEARPEFRVLVNWPALLKK